MLLTDELILETLLEEKKKGNKLLKLYNILFPDKNLAQSSNSIYIASVDAENYETGFDYLQFKDAVEILIVTKKVDYREAILIIKTVAREIIRVLRHSDNFSNDLIFSNITLEYQPNGVVRRGHIMVKRVCDPISDVLDDDEIKNVCDMIIGDVKVE